MPNQNQLSRYGSFSRIVPEGVLAPGAKLFLVADSDDTSLGTAPGELERDYPVDQDGVVRVYTTIQAAVNACAANRGDVVLALPNHVENFTRADSWTTAGVQIIGMGQGENRAGLTYNDVAATVHLRGNGIRVSNLMFLASVDSVAQAINMDTGFFGQKIDNCAFTWDATADNFQTFIRLGAKESVIEDNRLVAEDTFGGSKGIRIVGGDPDNALIRRNYIYGSFDSTGDTTSDSTNWGCIAMDTTNIVDTILSGLVIQDNVMVQLDSNTPQVVNMGTAGVTIRGIATNNQMATYDTAEVDTLAVLLNGLLGVNNFLKTGDSDLRQSIVSTTAALLHLDS